MVCYFSYLERIQRRVDICYSSDPLTYIFIAPPPQFTPSGGPTAIAHQIQSQTSGQASAAAIQPPQLTTQLTDHPADGVGAISLSQIEHQIEFRSPMVAAAPTDSQDLPIVDGSAGPRRNPSRAARGTANIENNRVASLVDRLLDDESDEEECEDEQDQSEEEDDDQSNEDEEEDEEQWNESEDDDRPNEDKGQSAPERANPDRQHSSESQRRYGRCAAAAMTRPLNLGPPNVNVEIRRTPSGVQSGYPSRAPNPTSLSNVLQMAREYQMERHEDETFRRARQLQVHDHALSNQEHAPILDTDPIEELISRTLETRGRLVTKLLRQTTAEDEELHGFLGNV
jgi:hypothetical protein